MHHVNKTLLDSPETTSPEFYPTAQLSVRGSKFLLSVQRSENFVCDDPAPDRAIPEKRVGG